jgi:hypothetical protein
MIPDEDIHIAAEKFLKEYLSKTGTKPEPVQPASTLPAPARRASEAQAAAKELIREHLKKRHQAKTEAERYEIEEPQQVILSRRSPRCVSYLCGFKRGLPVFTHDKTLALVVEAADSDKLSGLLREKHGIGTFVLPVPELRRGSL